MNVREIKPEEFEDLAKNKDMPDGHLYSPENSVMFVLENGNGIEGRMGLINLVHLEGAWLKESSWDVNYGFLLSKLEEAVLKKAAELGLKYIHTYAPSLLHEDLLQRMGWERLPVSVWSKKTEA